MKPRIILDTSVVRDIRQGDEHRFLRRAQQVQVDAGRVLTAMVPSAELLRGLFSWTITWEE